MAYAPIDSRYITGFDSPELIEQITISELEKKVDGPAGLKEKTNNVFYYTSLNEYIAEFLNSKEDFTQRVPLKFLRIEPETRMGGVLGYTYLGENFMVRRADLIGETARMVDIHESIHTPDEYETRVITRWIMEEPKHQYKR